MKSQIAILIPAFCLAILLANADPPPPNHFNVYISNRVKAFQSLLNENMEMVKSKDFWHFQANAKLAELGQLANKVDTFMRTNGSAKDFRQIAEWLETLKFSTEKVELIKTERDQVKVHLARASASARIDSYGNNPQADPLEEDEEYFKTYSSKMENLYKLLSSTNSFADRLIVELQIRQPLESFQWLGQLLQKDLSKLEAKIQQIVDSILPSIGHVLRPKKLELLREWQNLIATTEQKLGPIPAGVCLLNWNLLNAAVNNSYPLIRKIHLEKAEMPESSKRISFSEYKSAMTGEIEQFDKIVEGKEKHLSTWIDEHNCRKGSKNSGQECLMAWAKILEEFGAKFNREVDGILGQIENRLSAENKKDYKLLQLSQHLFKLYNLLEKILQANTINPNRKLMHEALISARELRKFLPQSLHRANFAVPEMPDPFLVLKLEFENKSMSERLEIFTKNLLIVHENVAIMNEEEPQEFSQYIYDKFGQMAEHVQEEKQNEKKNEEKNVEFSGKKSYFSRKKKALMAKLQETVEREQRERQLPSPGTGIANMMAHLREQEREQHEEQPRVQAGTSRRFHSQPKEKVESDLAVPYQPPKSG